MLLIYPVISMEQTVTHGETRENCLGKDASDRLVRLYSNELQVTAETPPALLVHALDDRAVPIENSLRFHPALRDHNISAELVIYDRGGYGFGLVSEPGPVAEWPLRCRQWLMRQGLLDVQSPPSDTSRRGLGAISAAISTLLVSYSSVLWIGIALSHSQPP